LSKQENFIQWCFQVIWPSIGGCEGRWPGASQCADFLIKFLLALWYRDIQTWKKYCASRRRMSTSPEAIFQALEGPETAHEIAEIKKFHFNSIFFTFLFSENLFLSNLNIQQYVWRWNFFDFGVWWLGFLQPAVVYLKWKRFQKLFIQYVGLWIRNHIVGTLLYSGS